MTPEEKKEKIAFHIEQVLLTLGLDLSNPSLAKTPVRVATMYVDEIFTGLDPTTYPASAIYEETTTPQLILVKDIFITSFCEHHLLPMVGKAHVAYVPKNGVIGLSHIHKLLSHFALRPQLQERLTEECATALVKALGTEDVAVGMQMKHMCVISRGVKDGESEVETFILKGSFETNPSLRADFFARIL